MWNCERSSEQVLIGFGSVGWRLSKVPLMEIVGAPYNFLQGSSKMNRVSGRGSGRVLDYGSRSQLGPRIRLQSGTRLLIMLIYRKTTENLTHNGLQKD
ncbi:hypothetical protein GDO81_019231 [Engystomops pustulosus]|uniref:Uncharacterized protein n=1 Tax=Engystomops pustulosus TaxID=76066 RepID=A0AAV6ZID9_ENGPU|nr:hypothetical protein GDO81_019231 [Engystomops pustulosus]